MRARAPDVQPFLRDDRIGDSIPAHGRELEPEVRDIGLLGRANAAVRLADCLEILEVTRVFPARQRLRPRQLVIGELDGERRDPAPTRKQCTWPQRWLVERRREIVVTRLTIRHVRRAAGGVGPVAHAARKIRSGTLLSERNAGGFSRSRRARRAMRTRRRFRP